MKQVINPAEFIRANGGTGRRAAFRALWEYSREGSSPSLPTTHGVSEANEVRTPPFSQNFENFSSY